MNAFKYYYMPLKEIGLGGIVVEPTPEMVGLQKKFGVSVYQFGNCGTAMKLLHSFTLTQ
jgi:hypothetical protein